ncbi:CBS domain-containing protein [Streptomyces sp. GQFP]|uniref:CBS domain-containing protein n=1 Tax=Streptomyces sp. GQFP TaxID=2907545 RepID=UPI001F2ACAD6|nr:CBS domain-containing protein [Streptomyces sp. GQFP]UIX34115.1 hypothetical protein LUX31_31220 [Streptomyces sp. GQFP]
MRARDLAGPGPFVTTDDDAMNVARLPAERSLSALPALDTGGQPYAIVPRSQLVRQLLPADIAEDPVLARIAGAQHPAELAERLAGLTAAESAPRRLYPPPVVGPDARRLEVAILMARTHSPLVALVERDGTNVTVIGTVTAARLMRYFLEGTP